MTATTVWPWATLLLLGAVHGVNPGMGWLFAVALGLQEGSGRAVWRALPPLMIGHALAVAAAVGLAAALGLVIAPAGVRWLVAAALVVMGLMHLVRRRHIRFGGMRVGPRDLVIWSFLMASAHGAGIMALPFVPTDAYAAAPTGAATGAASTEEEGGAPAPAEAGAHGHHHHGPARAGAATDGEAGNALLALLATVIHTIGYLLALGAVAALVYYRLGLRLLRTTWINVDRIWAAALIVTAVVVVVA
jgi:hypothetical protein